MVRALKKIFVVSNFRIDTDPDLPSDMLADDLVSLFRDETTSVVDTASLARMKKKREKRKYCYTLSCSGKIV